MSAFPLNHFPSGSKVTIAGLNGGGACKSRLYTLGITPGTKIQITSGGPGPCKMKVRDTELVLGNGLASKIMAFAAE